MWTLFLLSYNVSYRCMVTIVTWYVHLHGTSQTASTADCRQAQHPRAGHFLHLPLKAHTQLAFLGIVTQRVCAALAALTA